MHPINPLIMISNIDTFIKYFNLVIDDIILFNRTTGP